MLLIFQELYTDHAGLFDMEFTRLDLVQVRLIVIGASTRLFYELQKLGWRNMKILNIIFTYIITYAVTGGIYDICIEYNIAPKLLNTPLLIISTQALTIMNYFHSKKGQEKLNGGLGSILDLIIKKIEGWKPK